LNFTGNIIKQDSTEVSEKIYVMFDSSSEMNWTPKEEGKIKSIKISGIIEGDGDAKILLDDILIFGNPDNVSGNQITGNFMRIMNDSTNETDENITDTNQTVENTTENIDNSTNQTVENITEINQTIENTTNTNQTVENITETNQTIENTTNTNQTVENTTDDDEEEEQDNDDEEDDDEEEKEEKEETKSEAMIAAEKRWAEAEAAKTKTKNTKTTPTQKTTVTIPEPQKRNFEDSCQESCQLKKKLKQDNYQLTIILDPNTKLIIEKIIYEII
jgi:chemotaxis protein histidine kinase CheA